MSRIKVIKHEEAEGKLKEIYDGIVESRGQLADVLKIQSLRPESIVKHVDLYMEIMFAKSELSRAQREMIAVIVSVANNCVYCATHHGSALQHYWKDEVKLNTLKTNYPLLEIPKNEMALCDFASIVTLHPEANNKSDLTMSLRNFGWSDAAILDATLVVSYFNFVNRMVLTLGVELEKDQGKNYNY